MCACWQEASRLLRGYNGGDLVGALQLPEATITAGKVCEFDVQVSLELCAVCFIPYVGVWVYRYMCGCVWVRAGL